MKNIVFTKMQGLGNDFVVLEGPMQLTPEETAELCDRRFGIGADGVLIVTNIDPIRMEYMNADGSPAEMCGNGLRCVARYAYDRGWSADRNFMIQTPMGTRGVKVLESDVEVELGRTSVTGHTEIDGDRYHLIDVGNPHAVVIVDDPADVDVACIGASVSSDDAFDAGTNVEFVAISDDKVEMRVWERGVGETLACGTGMVASAFVATKTHQLESPITVAAPGGEGQVSFRDGVAWLRGPADYVFRGSVGGR
ncbi:MAG: diaminopimelate epimerase [Actinomycetota bacterium]|nr:diaminopimelate epimerase [Actinomycetota bacterium]